MNDEKTGERKPKDLSFVTGHETLIYEVERACGQLNKLKELQLNEPLFRAVAAEIYIVTDTCANCSAGNDNNR
jgi:hypothetical protein